ncbi:MAG: TIM barrel protein [Bacteroidota bacterium]
MSASFSRRAALKTLGGSALLASVAPVASAGATPLHLKGNIKHSVCKWCYPNLSMEEMAKAAKEMGIESIEIIGPEDWPIAQQYGLTVAMASGGGNIPNGFCDPANHSTLIESYTDLIPKAAKAGLPNVICFSGNRNGMDDEEGLQHCVVGLQKLMPLAEQHGVTLVMELLNSKVDHADYMCDRTPWGVELVKQVGSERFKLLYDIYHMQIMEGDVIRTIRDNHEYIAHYHTGGNPGRNEIDETQELNYPAIMRAIVETGYTGYVGQEFIPKRDPLTSLREAVALCDV